MLKAMVILLVFSGVIIEVRLGIDLTDVPKVWNLQSTNGCGCIWKQHGNHPDVWGMILANFSTLLPSVLVSRGSLAFIKSMTVSNRWHFFQGHISQRKSEPLSPYNQITFNHQQLPSSSCSSHQCTDWIPGHDQWRHWRLLQTSPAMRGRVFTLLPCQLQWWWWWRRGGGGF